MADQVGPPQGQAALSLGVLSVPTGLVPIQPYVFGFKVPDPESQLHPGFLQIAFLFADGTMRLIPLPFEMAMWIKDRFEEHLREIGSGLQVATQADIIALHDGDKRVHRD